MIKASGIISQTLLAALRRDFALDWQGIHGIRHWGRVRGNGLRLAAVTGANSRVVELFAVLHDSRRLNDNHDPDHGSRGAENARRYQGRFFHLDVAELELLCEACRGHSTGRTEVDLTVQTCWDADRLDLGRVGIEPAPARLCTAAARRICCNGRIGAAWSAEFQSVLLEALAKLQEPSGSGMNRHFRRL